MNIGAIVWQDDQLLLVQQQGRNNRAHGWALLLLIQGLRRRILREPIVAYLEGAVGPGAFWYYTVREDGEDEFVTRH